MSPELTALVGRLNARTAAADRDAIAAANSILRLDLAVDLWQRRSDRYRADVDALDAALDLSLDALGSVLKAMAADDRETRDRFLADGIGAMQVAQQAMRARKEARE